MGDTVVQWIGSSCGRHGSYTFYRGFRISVDDKVKNYCLGEFYFVRNSCDQPMCVAELQLVWYDANTDTKLASARLYFCPKDTPFGGQNSHGEDELLYADQKVVIKCADMLSWECSGADWNHGLIALNESNFIQRNDSFLFNGASLSNNGDSAVDKCTDNTGTSKIIILTFPAYCRYRALLKRLSGSYLSKPQVLALGGIIASDNRTRITFCRDCFHNPDLDNFDLSGETKAPVLKGRPRRKKKLRGVPVTNVLKKKKFIDDIQNCLSEEQGSIKRLKTSDEEDTESDRSEASSKSSDIIKRDARPRTINKTQGPPPLRKPVAHVKVDSIQTQNGLPKARIESSVASTLSNVPPLISTNKMKKTALGQGLRVCVPLHPLKADLQPSLNSGTVSTKLPSSVKIRQDLAASIKKEQDMKAEKLSSPGDAKAKPLDGSIKPNAAAIISTARNGVQRSQDSVSFVPSGVTANKTEVKLDPDGQQPRCLEGQGVPTTEKDMNEGKENVKGNPPKKRKRLRQPGDLKEGLEEYEDEDEKFFMHSLREFMKARNTPIGKIPALGFKKVNLWTMYNTTQKLGGYDVVTSKRLWRYVYDSLGGSTTITSAATYSRRHYERLLLPYERYVRSQLLEKKADKKLAVNPSPIKTETQCKPSPPKVQRPTAAGAPVSSCPPSAGKIPTGPETVTASSQASQRRSESSSLFQTKAVLSHASPKVRGGNFETVTARVEEAPTQPFTKVGAERCDGMSRVPTSIPGRIVDSGAAVQVQGKDVPAGEARERTHALPGQQLHGPTRKTLAEEQYDAPGGFIREQQVTSKGPARGRHEVPMGPSREQPELAKIPPKDVSCVPHGTFQRSPDVAPVSREHGTPKDRYDGPGGFSREYHGMQQRDVPNITSRVQDNAAAKKAKERCSELGTFSKDQRTVGTKQCDAGGRRVEPAQERLIAAEAKAGVRASHESSKRLPKPHRDLSGIRLPEEQTSLQGMSREHGDGRSRTVEVSKTQRGATRAPSRHPHNDHPSRARLDVTETSHPAQKDAPRLPSRDGFAGPVGGEKAPSMNERPCPRNRLEVLTSMGVIDLTDDDNPCDPRAGYKSPACPPLPTSHGLSRCAYTLTAHEVREAMMSEPAHRAMQQIHVCKGHAHDDQLSGGRKLPSKPETASRGGGKEKSADRAHTKIKKRFHPYLMDDMRVTHSPSRDNVEEHLDEWARRRLFAQRAHGLMAGMQADGFHFFPSPYGCLPREPDCPQERRKESRKESSTEKQQELAGPYPEALAFQACLSPPAVSEASAFAAMRSAHASATKEELASMEHLYPTSRIFMPPPQLFPQMVPMSPSVLAAGPALIAGSEEQFHIHPHCLMAAPYPYPGGSASIPYPLHSFT